jgi:DNA modification methylase
MTCGRKIGPYDCCSVVEGDCLELMKALPDGCVDAVVTDPPYGNGTEYDSISDTQENLQRLVDGLMPEVLRVGRRALITPGVSNISLYPRATWIMAWVTPAGAGSGPWGFACWQPILAYGADPYLAAGMGRRGDYFIHTEIAEKNGHPCPKPIDLWTKLILRGSVRDGETILDPFGGSGTTAEAAIKLGRHFLLFEKSPNYCELIRKRIAAVEAQPNLFQPKAEQLNMEGL